VAFSAEMTRKPEKHRAELVRRGKRIVNYLNH
jgi:hypothetical protein